MSDSTWNSPILAALDDDVDGVKDGCATPAVYSSVEEEHDRIRNGIGLVDYSFFGTFELSGDGALELADRVCMSAIDRLPINRIQRTFILNEDGSPLCDAHVINTGDGYTLLTEGTEPSNVLDVIEAEQDALDLDVTVTDETQDRAIIGLDGPFSWELAKDLFGMRIIGVRYLDAVPDQEIDGTQVTVYRAGKAGEFSFWIEAPAEDAADLWTTILEAGADYDLTPVGHETIELCLLENRSISMEYEGEQADNVLELNTRVMLDRYKESFRGSESVAVDQDVGRRLVGLRVETDAVPQKGATVEFDGETIGTVANAAHSPTLDTPIAVAFLDSDYAYAGLDDYSVEGDVPVTTVSAPFVLNRSLEIRPQENSYFDENE